ncbi:unnamed protein product [Ambrosiozyma monospora]|uniref:Unnamed protein product n=1 Tax=Ambrosiozyma monospora TaxID=43982 RepID=A0ACB5T5K5_AMBMO|nr:unnamed protein product [Ambrosiozyma monospora]
MVDSTSNIKSNIFGYLPNKGANLFFLAVWLILTICQASLAILTRELFFGVSMSIGCGLELIGYIGRVLAHSDPYSLKNYMMNSIGTVISPVFFMAGIYNCFGTTIEIFGRRYSHLKPINYRRIFISLDVVSFLVQSSGGGLAAKAESGNANLGFNIMLGGLILQVITMTVFMVMVGRYFSKVHANRFNLDQKYVGIRISGFFQAVMWSILAAILLIYIRSIYRVAEMANGWGSDIMHNETLFLVLDGFLCVLAIVLLTVFYPGFAFKRKKEFVHNDNYVGFEEDQVDLNELDHGSRRTRL